MSKPKVKTTTSVDILEVLHYMESIGHKGIYKRVWDHICECGDFRNDCYIDGYRVDPGGFWDDGGKYQELIQDLKDIEKEFGPIYKGLLQICW